jgi:hypothetical protein
MEGPYKRTPEQLKELASRYWAQELRDRAASLQVLPLLLETQPKFIDILHVADGSPIGWKSVLEGSSLSPNLFLKHLMVLANVSGEILRRVTPIRKSEMVFNWKGEQHEYRFFSVHENKMSNRILKVDTKSVVKKHSLEPPMQDVIMLILFGGAAINLDLPGELIENCSIGGLLGNREAIERFVCQRYIVVSAILRGATSNELGQAVQDYVIEFLRDRFNSKGWSFARNTVIPGISPSGDTRDITFDIVAKSPAGWYIAIEVSFQVTTNSVIERKAGQAKARYETLHQAGHRIAYVIDGAGNLEREAALREICQFSDCTVAFSASELELLAQFLEEQGGEANGSLE